MSLLTARDLTKCFGGVHAVDGVDLTLEEGEFTALIGPNGAGKSTLFALLAGQIEADRGTVEFEGQPLRRLSAAATARRGMGRTFQTAQVFGSMTVIENLLLALEVARGSIWRPWARMQRHRADALELLARVGLAAAATRAPTQLAYGDVKRLELAVALAGSPRLLLMDEPTAGMAAAERLALMDLVHEIAAGTGLTVLFTEHSMEVVFGYARRVLLMSQGSLVAQGAPEAVRADPLAQAAYFAEQP